MATAERDTSTLPYGWSTRYTHNALVSGPSLETNADSATGSDETKARFVGIVRARLEKLKSTNVTAHRMDDRVLHTALLSVAVDPAISLPGDICEGTFPVQSKALAAAKLLMDSWDTQSPVIASAGGATDLSKPVLDRSAADKRAQRLVSEAWNNGRCLLSGMPLAEGAHIVPVRALNLESVAYFYRLLQGFWALPDLGPDDLVLTGRENTNILPLTATVHQAFDRYRFALLPTPQAEHETTRRLSVQIIFLDQNAKDAEGRRLPRASFITDSRRGHDNADTGLYESPHVRNGDVFEICTSDPTTCPLPDVRLLQIQYAVHVMMAGIRAAGALKDIFHGDPPSTSGPTYDVAVPDRWRSLLEAAVDAEVLTQDESDAWGDFFTCHAILHAIRFHYELPGLPAEGRAAWIEVINDGTHARAGDQTTILTTPESVPHLSSGAIVQATLRGKGNVSSDVKAGNEEAPPLSVFEEAGNVLPTPDEHTKAWHRLRRRATDWSGSL